MSQAAEAELGQLASELEGAAAGGVADLAQSAALVAALEQQVRAVPG